MKNFLFTYLMLLGLNSVMAQIKSITIGKQIWMAAELNVEKFRNGDPIAPGKFSAWEGPENSTQPAWVFEVPSEDAPANKAPRRLYNGYVATDARGVCPSGWRMPSWKDWEQLIEFYGDEKTAANTLKTRYGWGEYDEFWMQPTAGEPVYEKDERYLSMINDAGYLFPDSKPKQYGALIRCIKN